MQGWTPWVTEGSKCVCVSLFAFHHVIAGLFSSSTPRTKMFGPTRDPGLAWTPSRARLSCPPQSSTRFGLIIDAPAHAQNGMETTNANLQRHGFEAQRGCSAVVLADGPTVKDRAWTAAHPRPHQNWSPGPPAAIVGHHDGPLTLATRSFCKRRPI